MELLKMIAASEQYYQRSVKSRGLEAPPLYFQFDLNKRKFAKNSFGLFTFNPSRSPASPSPLYASAPSQAPECSNGVYGLQVNCDDESDIDNAARKLFVKRTKTLCRWMYPNTDPVDKARIEMEVFNAWDKIGQAEKNCYISQVLGRFGGVQTILMVNPQLQAILDPGYEPGVEELGNLESPLAFNQRMLYMRLTQGDAVGTQFGRNFGIKRKRDTETAEDLVGSD